MIHFLPSPRPCPSAREGGARRLLFPAESCEQSDSAVWGGLRTCSFSANVFTAAQAEGEDDELMRRLAQLRAPTGNP